MWSEEEREGGSEGGRERERERGGEREGEVVLYKHVKEI